jgi:hypothetical protein
MQNRQTGTGPVAVPSLDEEKEADFDWDRKLRVCERARQALELMRVAMDNYGNAGQPLLLAGSRSPPGAEARAWVGIGPERTRG